MTAPVAATVTPTVTPAAGPRRAAVVSVAIGAVALVVLAWWRVPWQPVPGGPVHPVAVGEVFTTAQVRRADSYLGWARVWSYASLGVTVVLAVALGFTRAGAALVGRVRGPWWWQVVVTGVGVEALVTVVALPFAALSHGRAVRFGLSDQGWGAWGVDQLTSLGVGVVALTVALMLLVATARRLPGAWPAVAGSLLAAFVLLGSFVYPLLVEPLSNHFEPLPHGTLRTEILRLADREGVHVDDVLVADASRRTTTLNAYVSGFGSSRRVVVYDNLLDDVDRRQVLSVVGHELGHAKHDDVLTGSLLGAAGALLGVGLLALVLDRRRGPGIADPRTVPRVLALVVVAMVVVSPVQNAFSRRIETRADVESLRYEGDPTAFVELQRNLAVRSLADPTPPAWAQFWFGTHPTARERVAIAQRYERTPW